jgi:hypothetical protein
MKRWIIPLLVGFIFVAVWPLTVPSEAGASTVPTTATGYCSTSQVPGGMLGWPLGSSATTATKRAYRQYLKAGGTPCTTGPQSHITTQLDPNGDFFTLLVTFNHQDLKDLAFVGFAGGVFAEATYACGALPGWIATGACVYVVAAGAAEFAQMVVNILNYTQYLDYIWCAPGQWLCSAMTIPGARWDPFYLGGGIWQYPVQDSGLNILFTWIGIPIAVEQNNYSG